MKKLVIVFLSFIFLSFQSAYAERGIGITGAIHMLEADGTETTRSSNEKNNGNHSETVVVPEIFIEETADNGITLGLSYIPTRELGSKSRSDTNSAGDTGTYKAEAELDNVIQVYADIPVSEYAGYPIYGKLGIQHATITTLESLNSGTTYPDEDVFGLTLGVGTKGDLGNNLYYKTEATYTIFEEYAANATDNNGNKVEADLTDFALKLSIGYKF